MAEGDRDIGRQSPEEEPLDYGEGEEDFVENIADDEVVGTDWQEGQTIEVHSLDLYDFS